MIGNDFNGTVIGYINGPITYNGGPTVVSKFWKILLYCLIAFVKFIPWNLVFDGLLEYIWIDGYCQII